MRPPNRYNWKGNSCAQRAAGCRSFRRNRDGIVQKPPELRLF